MNSPSKMENRTSPSTAPARRAAAPWARRVRPGQGYELWAPNYDHDLNSLLALEERELAPLLPKLERKDVLDLACGTGRWLDKLLHQGARSAAGIDVSAAMLAQAAAKPALHGRLVRGDCAALPFRAGSADVVVLSFAVGHIPDLDPLARELKRVARAGAHLFVTDLHPHAYARGWRCAFRHLGKNIQIENAPPSLERLVATFSSQGFDLAQLLEPRLGEPERPIFEKSGRVRFFVEACQGPAIFICHFQSAGAAEPRP